jgi:predicted aspartyl protease
LLSLAAAVLLAAPANDGDTAGNVQFLTIVTGPSAILPADVGLGLDGPVIVRRAADQLFYVDVLLGTRPVTMVVDTGATRTMVSTAALGLAAGEVAATPKAGMMRTLSGQMAYHRLPATDLTVGSRTIRHAQIGVFDSDRQIAVLGQDVLAQLGPVVIDGDWLHLP